MPCGIKDREVCSLATILGECCPSLDEVKESVEFHFAELFDLELLHKDGLPP